MSNLDLDTNKIVVDIFTSMLKDSASTITNLVKSPIAKLIDAFKFSMDEYISSTLKKCSNIRTFLNRDEAVPLLDVYVSTNFKTGKNTVQYHKM